MDYAGVAVGYADDVVAGRIAAAKITQAACRRFLADLDRWGFKPDTPDADPPPYVFDPDRANAICEFAAMMPHIRGRWARAGGTLDPEPWQVFAMANVFGWVDSEGLRRFRMAYVEVPRKNGKSTLTAPLALYMLTEDGEPGAECYSAATTRDQARIVFDVARLMSKRSKEFCRVYGLHVGAHNLHVEATASKLEALSSDAHSLDGLNIHFACVDELHAHKTRTVWDVLETAMGSREQPLMWAITTAGYDRTGVCFETRSYVAKVLDGIVEDDRVFGLVYTIDDDDDWSDPAAWAKANPNLGVSVNVEDLTRLAAKAKETPAAVNTFLTKRLNVWTSTHTAWLDVRRWQACANPDIALAEFEGRRVFLGVDLATKIDLAALAIWIPPVEVGEMWRLFTRFYLPEARVEESAVYAGFEREGRIIATPGDTTDLEYIDADVRDLAGNFEVAAIGYDPWQASQMGSKWLADGLPAIEVPARTRHYSEPMREIERLVYSGEFEHDDDPVMAWCVSNVVARTDANDNIYPRKESAANKIDGVVAAIIGLSRAMLDAAPKVSVYETRGLTAI